MIPKGQYGFVTRLAGKVLPAASRFGERMLTKSPRIGKLVDKAVNKIGKKIDGIWGKQSKAAQAAYDKANGKHGETVFEAISRNKQNLLNQAKGIESKKKIEYRSK